MSHEAPSRTVEIGFSPAEGGGQLCRVTVPCKAIVGGSVMCGTEAYGDTEQEALVGVLRRIRKLKLKRRATSRGRLAIGSLDAIFLVGRPAREVTSMLHKLAKRVESGGSALTGSKQDQAALAALLQAAPQLREQASLIAKAPGMSNARAVLTALLPTVGAQPELLQAAASLPAPFGPAFSKVAPIAVPLARKATEAIAKGAAKWGRSGARAAAGTVRSVARGAAGVARRLKLW